MSAENNIPVAPHLVPPSGCPRHDIKSVEQCVSPTNSSVCQEFCQQIDPSEYGIMNSKQIIKTDLEGREYRVIRGEVNETFSDQRRKLGERFAFEDASPAIKAAIKTKSVINVTKTPPSA